MLTYAETLNALCFAFLASSWHRLFLDILSENIGDDAIPIRVLIGGVSDYLLRIFTVV
jgi:hypothetical protein